MRSAEARRSWWPGLADHEPADQHAGVDREHGEDRRHGGGHRLDRSRGGRRAGRHQGDQRAAGDGEGACEAARDNLGLEGLDGDEGEGQSHRQADQRSAGQNGRRSHECHARRTLESLRIAAIERDRRRQEAAEEEGRGDLPGFADSQRRKGDEGDGRRREATVAEEAQAIAARRERRARCRPTVLSCASERNAPFDEARKHGGDYEAAVLSQT